MDPTKKVRPCCFDMDEFERSRAKKRAEMAYMNQETGWYDNTGNTQNLVHILFNYLIAIIGRDMKRIGHGHFQ
ncbi:MAG: hypothetical protein WA364_23130 [Candidatus Nitrosopolaris sp.]